MPEQIVLITLIIAIIFSTVHLTAPKLYGFSERYGNGVVSFSGGIAAAYVFFDLLPTIQKAGEHLNLLLRNYLGQLFISEVAIFGVAFMGFLVFFISEHAAVHSRRRAAVDTGQHMDSVAAPKGVFVIHFSILALVSLLIAYNLRFEVRSSLIGALLFSIALILHFFGTDRTMEIHYHSMFEKYGRYILSIMPITGWALSIRFPERRSEAAVLLAFVAGAVLFNVIKDEVPGTEKGEPKFFVAGALIYAAVLLLLL
ncbi:hypothetical protein [Candidatus Methanoperedens nitratireducens]|uniref:Putative Divalent heavy-metal cations transporter n=1 Tax=Candidatus Methanoperedens nitratireducens TaxID=1392998 RepID=A0A284VKH9_9EURY|nr:hypothetical protein [Candidatus Methanoperedens nitroreducens]SNQ59774.1 putative Divalent heavy-metal cations transporter [Candidatus Methanoperedens nitroreducens]